MHAKRAIKLLQESKWWSNMTGNFVGALLGILVTFGTSSYMEYRNKQKMTRRTTLITIHNIDRYIQSMEQEILELKHQDSIFQFVLSKYPDQFHSISRDTLGLFLSCLSDIHIFALDTSAEGIFTHSIDVWKNMENITVIEGIGDCFAVKNMFVSFYEDTRNNRRSIYLDFCAQKYITDYKTIEKAVWAFLSMPRGKYFVAEYGLHIYLLDNCIDVLKALNQRNKKIMSITEEELQKITDDFEWKQKKTIFEIKKKKTVSQ